MRRGQPAGSTPFGNPRATPHVRLNSGQDNILETSHHQPSSRSLTSRGRPQRPTVQTRNLYRQARHSGESAELLLPPRSRAGRGYRDEDSPVSPPYTGNSSRRSSWGSDSGTDSPVGPFASPFDDARSQSRAAEAEAPDVNTQTVSDKYNIAPSNGLLIFPEDVEKDDWLHNPDPTEKDGFDCVVCSKRGLLNLSGLLLLTLGLLVVFIGYPALTFVQNLTGSNGAKACAQDPNCINVGKVPLLANVRTSLIDPDTPQSVMTRKGVDGKTQKLVFSDEFNKDGRTFYPGDDAYFTAVDIWYGVTQDLEWYDPDAVTTSGGTLNIRFDAMQNHGLNYRSGMLQSWNQMCFKGGRLEASISLPGQGDTSGFWPGFWAMGNLGRPGYAATTDGMWPYSYDDVCDAGISPNQSDPSGLSYLPGMRLPACSCVGEDHPSPGKSRGAPEIDVIEASVAYLAPPNGAAIGSASQSMQCAPFDVFWRPDVDFIELYDNSITTLNSYEGGVYQQAISGLSNLNNDWYDGKAYQSYAFEYTPGSKGKVTWFIGESATWAMDARALGPNGNVGQRVVPVEPMALVVNFGMSNGFAPLNMTGLASLMPATMRVDYIRIYQDEDDFMITCDPPEYPTTQYIANHPEAYSNPNLTMWSQTSHPWPKNSLMNGCKAQNFNN